MDDILGYQIDYAFSCLNKIPSCILGTRGSSGESDYEGWWVVIYNLEVGERSEIFGSV